MDTIEPERHQESLEEAPIARVQPDTQEAKDEAICLCGHKLSLHGKGNLTVRPFCHGLGG